MLEDYLPAIILAAIVLFLYRLMFGRRKSSKKSARVNPLTAISNTASSASGKYRAVSCVGPCSAVRELREKRFLERQAPSLPLPGCNEARCTCIYEHHKDRRSGRKDRRGLGRNNKDAFDYSGQAERRNRRGRRAGDLVPA